MEVKKILWPLDLSKTALAAADHVATMAQKYGAEVIVIYVGHDLMNYFPAYGNYPSPEINEEFRIYEEREAKERLEKLCSDKLGSCMGIKRIVTVGNPADEIIKTATSENVDVIVMASHGHDPSQQDVIFNSVAEDVTKNSPVPVYVINAKTGE